MVYTKFDYKLIKKKYFNAQFEATHISSSGTINNVELLLRATFAILDNSVVK